MISTQQSVPRETLVQIAEIENPLRFVAGSDVMKAITPVVEESLRAMPDIENPVRFTGDVSRSCTAFISLSEL
jgi:hypothetical protein